MNTHSVSTPIQDTRELKDEELDTVTGGLVVNAIIGVLIPLLLPAVQKVREA